MINRNDYSLSPDGKTLKEWFNTSIEDLDMNMEEQLRDITKIGWGAFRNCTSLKTIKISKNVTDISGAFIGCASLVSVEIPKGVTHISGAFTDCVSLPFVQIPEGVTYIRRAFKGCTSLSFIKIPQSVTEDTLGAFDGCASLVFAELPKSLKRIEEGTFRGCISMSSVIIPENVGIIESGAFEGCTSLTSVEIPASVTRIGWNTSEQVIKRRNQGEDFYEVSYPSGAFEGCTSLKKVKFLTRFGRRYYFLDGEMWGEEGIAIVWNGTFKDCTSLTSIEFPKTIRKIGTWVFPGCKSLSSVIIKSKVPPILGDPPKYISNSFHRSKRSIELDYTFFVPKESVELYKTDREWCEYDKNIEPMDDRMWDFNEWVDDEIDEKFMLAYLEKIKERREKEEREKEKRQRMERDKEMYGHIDVCYYDDDPYDPYNDVYNYDAYAPYRNDYDWLSEIAGTNDPEVMNDVYWNMD